MKKVIIVVLLVIIAILAIALFRPSGNEPGSASPGVTDSSSDSSETDEPEEPIDVQSYDYIFNEVWEHTERATEAVQDLAPGQVISGPIVEDPTDSDISYFATSAFDRGENENLVSVYKYNTSDYSFERLFRATYGTDSQFTENKKWNGKDYTPSFNIVGYDTQELLINVVPQLADDGCGEFLIPGPDQPNLVKMNIESPYDGLSQEDLFKQDSSNLTGRSEWDDLINQCNQ